MSEKYNLISKESFETILGPIKYNLTNDYMFKATLQECNEALLGIISALLRVEASSLEVSVVNPILLGRNVVSKDFFLDVHVIVNHYKHMNLEMQVSDEGNWLERSVSYTSRLYDSLYAGQDYKNAIPVHHVGFINFDIYDDTNKFYDTFALTNSDSTKIYTNKFLVSVVNLRHIDKATYEDKLYKLDMWARLITAKTWENLKEIAKEDPYMEATARKFYELAQDFDALEEARRREEYYARLRHRETKIAEQDATIAEQDATIAEQDATIAEQDATIAEQDATIAEQDATIAEQKAKIAEQDAEIARLKAQLNIQ